MYLVVRFFQAYRSTKVIQIVKVRNIVMKISTTVSKTSFFEWGDQKFEMPQTLLAGVAAGTKTYAALSSCSSPPQVNAEIESARTCLLPDLEVRRALSSYTATPAWRAT